MALACSSRASGGIPPQCAELKWLAAALEPARDGEVLLARITADLAAIPAALALGPVQARITDCFTAGLARAGQSALGALEGQRYLRLLDDLGMARRLQRQKQLPDSGWSAEAACHRGTGGRGPSGISSEAG